MKKFVFVLLSIICISAAGQAPVYEDLIIDADSVTSAYRSAGKSFAFVRSKRGTDGVAKTSKVDSILSLSLEITEIVLVFTEAKPGAINSRETANRERWENLLKTYPDLFQPGASLKSVCQCNTNGDTASFRKAQGFYIYFPGKEEPKVAEKKAEPKKVEEKKEEKPKKEKKVEKEEVAKEEKPKKEKKVKEEKPKKEEVAKKEEKVEETPIEPEPVVSTPKKVGYAKPKKAKDVKVCRPPCYEGGDEGLNNFLKDNITLSKKQKRHSGDLVTVVTLQLNFDGTIKKTIIQGANPEFNKQVEDAIKMMDLWNPAVKGGVTIKSQVKMTLKYDGSTKSIKPFETQIVPRPAPKCTECLLDSQVFAE